jgi:hypothetical protein
VPKANTSAAVLARGGVQEGQQQTGVALHGARHVHQHQQRQRLRAPLQPGQVHQLAAIAHGAAQHARPVQPRALCARARAARGKAGQREPDVARQPLDQPVLGARECVEVGVFQALQVARGHGRVELDLLVLFLRFGLVAEGLLRRQRLAHARSALARFRLALGAGQQLREQLLRDFRVAEIDVEQLAEHQPVLFAADQHRFHRSAHVLLALQAHGERCLGGERNARAVHPHPCAAQGAAKAADVVGQLAAAGITELHGIRPRRQPV